LVTLCTGTAWKARQKGHEDKKEDLSSYWMTFRKTEDIGTLKRKHYIALCGELALEETLDLLQAR
jgi:hypothetical protein